MGIKQKTFTGGYRFKSFQGIPIDKLIDFDIPDRVIIPLKQGFGNEVVPIVKPGTRVKAGQIIGRDDTTISTPVHSSVSGTVEGIKKLNLFKQEITVLTVKPDQKQDEILLLDGHSAEWNKLTVEKIEELLYLSGVTALDRAGIPTRFKSSIISPAEVESLIVHGVDSEPFNLSLPLLLGGKNIFYFIDGVKILKRIYPQANIYIAINKYRKSLVEQLSKLLAGEQGIELIALDPKYPQGYDEMLVPTLLGKKFPYGYSAANIGIIILNIQAILQIYQAVVTGKPVIDRIISLSGPCWQENVHLKVRIGTPLESIITHRLIPGDTPRIILNSILTGVKLTDLSLPIDKTFSQLMAIPENKRRDFLVFIQPGTHRDSYTRLFLSRYLPKGTNHVDTNVHGEARACISCGYCEEICPVRIIPHLIYKHVRSNKIDETLMKYAIFNCIECNLCSYVCPSKIALAKSIKDGQDKLIINGCDRNSCILPYFDLKGIEEYRGIK